MTFVDKKREHLRKIAETKSAVLLTSLGQSMSDGTDSSLNWTLARTTAQELP